MVLTRFSIVIMARAITLIKKTVKRDYGIIKSSSGHGNNNWKVSLKSNENCKRFAYTRLTYENLPKGHNSNNNQLSMSSVKYDHLQVMVTITGKFHQNPLRNVGGLAETRTSVDKLAKTDRGR